MNQLVTLAILNFAAIFASAQVVAPTSAAPTVTVVAPPVQNSNERGLSTRVSEQIRARVLTFASENYKIFSQGTQVTIQGQARNQAEVDEVLSAARTTPGIGSLVNAITLKPNL